MRAPNPTDHADDLTRLREVRAQAVEHTRIARSYSAERKAIMERLLAQGFSRADLARELGVTRQAVAKMLAS